MYAYDATAAADAVRRGIAGQATPEDGQILADLFRRAAGKRTAIAEVEAEANALAATVADVLDEAARDGAVPVYTIDPLVDRLPHDARRRVLAYRHAAGPFGPLGARDQFGPLPKVPPRTRVFRQRERTIDGDVVDDRPADVEPYSIEGYVVDALDTD